MKRVLTSLAAALALAVPALAQVAQIGDTTYADFNSFFTAFQAIAPSETPTTVTLLDDLTGDLAVPGTVPVKEGQTIVFDLNGRTMETALQREGRHYYAIDNYGTLTIKDSSAGQTGTIRARGVKNLDNGKLTIESGTIVSVDANGGACIWNEADVTVKGGTFKTEFVGTPSDEFGPACLNNSGTALVTGGTFHNVNRRTYAIISNKGSIEITPAEGSEVTVFGAHGGLAVDGGTAVVNGGSYSSSDYYGLYVSNDGLGEDPMQAAVTVNDGTFDGKTYSVWVGSDYNDPVNSTIAIKGGTFLKPLHRQDVSRPDAIQVSGGTFSEKLDNAWFADGFIPVENEDGTFGVATGSFAAEIAGVKYLTLQKAFDAATATDTIKLLSSVTDTPRLTLTNGKTVSIDLNGHDIGFVQNGRFQVNGGKLTLTGEGKVYEQAPDYGPILIMGSTEDIADYSVVDVGKDVTLEGWAPLFINNNAGCAYGVKVTMAGTVNSVRDTTGAAGHGVYINGSIKKTEGNVPQITLTETSKVTSIGNGIYAAGYAHWTLAGDVSGADALSIKCGTFDIQGGSYTAKGPFADPAEAHGNGSENTGAAVTITTNDGYAQAPIVMDISGTPTFTSENGYAFYEGIAKKADGTPAATASRAVIAIKGGDFTGSKTNEDVTADIAVTTAENKQVVSGGTFSKPVALAYCAPGYAPKQNADGTYSVVGWYETGVDTNDDGVADAWTIRNEGDLAAFRDKVNSTVTFAGCTVTLTADLDLSDMGTWIPIGEGNAGGASKNGGFFAGTFEGGKHLIANLHVSETKLAEGAGLFGWVRGATIRNLRVSGSILANVNGAAGIIGVVESDYVGNLSTTIENVHNVGDTVRGSKAGGIVGDIRRGGTVTIAGCTNAAAVTASINHSDQVDALCAGGIVGNAGGTSVAISGCSNSGAVTATPDEEGWTAETPTYAGGIVGRMGTGTLAAGNGDNTGAVSASGAGTVGQGAILGGMVAGTHPVVELALSQEEAEGGRATLFTGTSLDDASGLEVVPVLPEGMDEPDDFVVTLEDELFYCDLLYLADRVAGESEGVTFDANAQQALLNAAGGSMHGNIAVSGRTAVDKPLTTAQVNEALACFEGSGLIVVEGSLEGEKTLVVAYDFGITDVRVTGTGDLVVEVAAQDMSGRPLAFAEGATLSLRNGETALAATPATVEGVTTLTVPAANVPAGNLALSVSVAPAAAEEAPAN